MTTSLEIMQELVKEDLELMKEIIIEEIVPLIQFREKLERKEFEKAFKELKELEGGV